MKKISDIKPNLKFFFIFFISCFKKRFGISTQLHSVFKHTHNSTFIQNSQCKMKQSVSSQYRPASGAQVVDQTALEEETMAERTHDITAAALRFARRRRPPTLAMYSVTMNRLPFSSTITPSSCTRLLCRSCLRGRGNPETCHSSSCERNKTEMSSFKLTS